MSAGGMGLLRRAAGKSTMIPSQSHGIPPGIFTGSPQERPLEFSLPFPRMIRKSLRLVPIFLFFIINLAMGHPRMPLFTFFWVSQVGLLAGTIVHVNAGKELARIESLAGIMSPGVLISFAVLGLFPIAAKKLLEFFKKARADLRVTPWGNPRKVKEKRYG